MRMRFTKAAIIRCRIVFIAQRDKNMMLYMPCFLDSVIGTKMLSEFPDNSSLGIPYLNGLMILNNAKTGLPKRL